MRTQPTHHGLDRSASNDATARALVAAIPDPIFRIGVDGVYRGFKVDAEVDLLTPSDEVIGRSVHERLPPHIAEGVLAAGRRAVEDGVLQRVEYSLEIRGETRDYEGRIVAVRQRRVPVDRPGLHGAHTAGTGARARARLQLRGGAIHAELPRARRRDGDDARREPCARTRRRPTGGVMARAAVLEGLPRRGGRPPCPHRLREHAARRPARGRRVPPRLRGRRAPRRRLDGDRGARRGG